MTIDDSVLVGAAVRKREPRFRGFTLPVGNSLCRADEEGLIRVFGL